MIIKPTKGCKAYLTIPWIVCALAFLMFYFSSKNLLLSALLSSLVAIIALRCCFVLGRTLIIDENGCTVKFLCFKKRYRWKELKTIRIEDYRDCHEDGTPYQKGIIFSKHERVHRHKWFKPLERSIVWGNPFRFFFVYFKPTEERKNRFPFPKVYEVDEEEFIALLSEWGVQFAF